MDLFPRLFLLVFTQLAVGGMLALSIPPFHEIERGYYKSTAFVFLLMGALDLCGKIILWWGNANTQCRSYTLLEIVLLAIFLATGIGYFALLWGERALLRARLYALCWVAGVLALFVSAQAYRRAPFLSAESIVYPLVFVSAALVLGTVSAGMLLGHWYLIDRDLSLQPFRTLFAFYFGSLVLQSAVLFFGLLVLFALGSADTGEALHRLVTDHLALTAARLAVSPIASGVLAWMIWRTLQIPQTMAATGLFYIAILSVLVGELMGRYILFKTGLPL